ncbi:MAG: calcineurin-like phosphoesterase C-terminal domain-containing protein [Bacteroidales bacterium]|nr:calcineurin-like phosphoesterase C-terminal domain-containing protein [Bacteroidales bacterium]
MKRTLLSLLLLSVTLMACQPEKPDTGPAIPEGNTIGGFATQFVRVLDVWNSSIGSVTTAAGTFHAVHCLPAGQSIRFQDAELGKAEMLAVAMKATQRLAAGGTLSDEAPAPETCTYPEDPYREAVEFQADGLSLADLVALAGRQLSYVSENHAFAESCDFPLEDTGTAVRGSCSVERALLTYARFFQHLLDGRIVDGIADACGDRRFSCDLYGMEASIFGHVLVGDTPIPGVVVSDGYQVTATDADGYYALHSAKKNGYVFISVPSGYKVPVKGVFPQFFKRTGSAPTVREEIDFILTDDAGQENHTMLIFGDIHLAARTKDQAQFRTFSSEINEYVQSHPDDKIYAMTLGDMSWDQYWYTNSFDLMSYATTANAMAPLPVFHTIGNHDHDMNATGDWDTAIPYKTIIAPNYYSFNIGKIHYMVVDNIECTNDAASTTDPAHRTYNTRVVEDILEWIRRDLVYVDKDTPIVVTMHSAVWTNTGKNSLQNADEFADCFKDHSRVRFVSGHTHVHRTVSSVRDNIIETNSGAVCAAWWWGGYYNPTLNVTTDGAPGGYRIVSVRGRDMDSYYKGTGRPAEYQFRTYDRNSILIKAADYGITKYPSEFAEYLKTYGNYGTESSANQVLVNVWDYNTNWKVEASEDNQHFTACTRAWGYDPLYIIAYTAQRFKSTSSPTFKPGNCWHLFTYKASSASSTVYIKVTDDEGRVYTEMMKRPKTFSLATYK